jgi:tetratricopeptide (TPR) repeat protein
MEFDDIKPSETTTKILQNVDFTQLGEITIANLEIDLTPSQLSTISAWEFAHWIAIENWLTDYDIDDNATNLEQVRGYLEAFHHLCELSEWEKTVKILFLNTSFCSGKKVLHEQLFVWGYYQEQVNFYQRLLNKFGLEGDCFLLYGLGRAYSYLGKIQEAISIQNQVLNIAQKINNYSLQAQAYGCLGKIYEWQLEKYQESINYYQQQLAIARKINDKFQEASAIFGIAAAELGRLNYRKAIKVATQALSIVQNLKDIEMEINILGFIGVNYAQIGLAEKGIIFIEKQLQLSREIGNQYQECLALSRLGLSYANLRKFDLSLEYYQKALNIIDVLGEPSQKARTLNNIGTVYLERKQYLVAIEYLKSGLNINFSMSNKYLEVFLRVNLAYCYVCLKQSEALVHIDKALNIAKNLKSSELLGMGLARLAYYYWEQGNYIYGLILIVKSFWVCPPWKNVNSIKVFKTAIQVISNSFMQTIQRCIIYLGGDRN